jgi:uncharacterized protein (TIGR03382 family)
MLRLALPLLLLASPALGHPGPHLHPHGAEVSLSAMLAALAVAALAWLLVRRR